MSSVRWSVATDGMVTSLQTLGGSEDRGDLDEADGRLGLAAEAAVGGALRAACARSTAASASSSCHMVSDSARPVSGSSRW